jgi:hypothetical protein
MKHVQLDANKITNMPKTAVEINSRTTTELLSLMTFYILLKHSVRNSSYLY